MQNFRPFAQAQTLTAYMGACSTTAKKRGGNMRKKTLAVIAMIFVSCAASNQGDQTSATPQREITRFLSTVQVDGRPAPAAYQHIDYDVTSGVTSITTTPSSIPTTDANTTLFVLQSPKKELVETYLKKLDFATIPAKYLPDTTPASLGDGTNAEIIFYSGDQTKETTIDTMEPENLPDGIKELYDAIMLGGQFFVNEKEGSNVR